MTETADLSDDIDEIVQVTNTQHSNSRGPQAHDAMSPNSLSSATAAAMMDESTGQGFTTAPATSDDEDDASDEDDDEEEDDSQSNYSMSNHNTNTNSNMSVMTNGSGGGGRAARHYGRLSSGSSGGGGKGEEKRSHHNVLERKRRDLLKDSFARLRDSVPTTQPRERVSRAEILRQAADFIATTVQKNANVRAELDELIRKNREIEEKRARSGESSGSLVAGVTTSGVTTHVVAAPKVEQPTEATIKQES